MSTHAETLGGLDVYQQVTVTVDDGTTVEGEAIPVDFMPKESLHVEVDPAEGNVRYQFIASYEDGEWSDVRVQRVTPADDDWRDIGTVSAVEPGEEDTEDPTYEGA